MGRLMSKQAANEPKTVAEAKAEISEVLKKIKDHYDAINQMRSVDRNKWKSYNKRVEDLEVVKARALKEERKRHRDKQREEERNLLIERNFSSLPAPKKQIAYSGSGSKEKVSKSRESMSREAYKAKAAVRESSMTARDSAARRAALQESATAQAAVRDSSFAIVTSGVPLSEVDKVQPRERVEADKRDTKPKSKTTSERESRPKRPSPGEEEIIHIELPPPAPKKPDTLTDSDSVHRAKLVNLPFMIEDSDSQQSDHSAHVRSPAIEWNRDGTEEVDKSNQSKKDASDSRAASSKGKKDKPKRDEYVASVDLAEDKYRF